MIPRHQRAVFTFEEHRTLLPFTGAHSQAREVSALVRILRKKQAKRPVHAPAVKPSRENVVSLMDALRRSIAAERPAKSAPRRGLDKRAAVKRAARHRKAS